MMVVNIIPQASNLDEMRARVEKTYSLNVAAMLPYANEMMTLASSGIFPLKYPDHPISQGLKKVLANINA
jgi:MinD-like ATPase involved in chromosome partitioning or flagellar assembly